MRRKTIENEINDVIPTIENAIDCATDGITEYDLRKTLDFLKELQDYRNLEKQGLLIKFPCNVGDIVYTNISQQGWYLRKENMPYEAKIVFIGVNGVDNFMNVDFGNGRMLQFDFSDIGKKVFLTKEDAKQALSSRQ